MVFRGSVDVVAVRMAPLHRRCHGALRLISMSEIMMI